MKADLQSMQKLLRHRNFHTNCPDSGKKVLHLASVLLFFFLLPACTAKISPTIPEQDEPAQHQPLPPEMPEEVVIQRPRASESPYYYFTEAQIRLNRNRPLEAIGFLRQAAALDPQSPFLQRELAALLVRAGQPRAALQAIERARELDPRDPDTLIVLAGIRQMLEQDIQELIPIYEEVIRLDPTRERIYLILGNLYLAQKKPHQAEQIYRSLVTQYPENYAGYYYLGQLLSLLGKPEEALENFERVIEMAPQLLEPYLERIKILNHKLTRSLSVEIQAGDTLDALLVRHSGPPSPRLRKQVLALNPLLEDVDHLETGKRILMPPQKNNPMVSRIHRAYEELLEMDPASVEVLTDFALFLRQMGQEEAALTRMASLAAEDELREAAVRRIFSVFMENKRFRDAIFLLQGLLSGDPENAEIRYALGLAYEEAGMLEEARRHYLSIDPRDPVYRKAVVHLAYMDQQAGEVERGLAMLEAAFAANPEEPTLRLYLGAFYEEAGRLQEASDIFRNSLEQDPEDPHTRYRLGVVLDKMGEKEEAITQMEILISQNPDHANALNYLGYTLTEMGTRLDEAEMLIRRAMHLKPGDGYITDSMGWVYFKQGKAEKALPYLEQAARLLPEDPTILEHLGDVYHHLDDIQAAREAYEKSLFFREDPVVLEKLKNLADPQQATGSQNP
jgi:tetratricopeptide (TPR) repeat protein